MGLAEIVDLAVVPKKGKRSVAEAEREGDPEFIRVRRLHSGVQSAVNALEVHGLDICRDYCIDDSKRYVALAVVGRNLHRLGTIMLKQEAERDKQAIYTCTLRAFGHLSD